MKLMAKADIVQKPMLNVKLGRNLLAKGFKSFGRLLSGKRQPIKDGTIIGNEKKVISGQI